MTTTGLEVFDKTLHTTHIWLDELMEELGADRKRAHRGLAAVLQTLRDRLPVDDCAHLAAQLPILVRGVYFHDWIPALQPTRERTREEFVATVADRLVDAGPIDAEDAARAVFLVLNRHLSPGEIAKSRGALPEPIRALWPPPMTADPGLREAAERMKAADQPKRSAEQMAPPWPARK
jgi:uncharacterized protein (DUF2267 family)